MRKRYFGVIIVGLAVSSFGRLAAQSAEPEVAGIWSFLPAESESVDALDAQQKSPRPPRAVRGGSARPAGVPGGFGFPRGFDPQLTRDALEILRKTPDRLAISANGDTMVLVFGDAAPYAVITNGKKIKRPWVDGTEAEIKASFRGRVLRIERKLENELKITEEYEVDWTSGHLVVTKEIDGPMPRRLELRSVYERTAPPGS